MVAEALAWAYNKHGYWRCLVTSRKLEIPEKPRIKVSYIAKRSNSRWHQIHHCQESEELWARKNILENFQKRSREILYCVSTWLGLLNRLAERNLINGIQSIGVNAITEPMKQLCGIELHGSDVKSHFLFNPRLYPVGVNASWRANRVVRSAEKLVPSDGSGSSEHLTHRNLGPTKLTLSMRKSFSPSMFTE